MHTIVFTRICPDINGYVYIEGMVDGIPFDGSNDCGFCTIAKPIFLSQEIQTAIHTTYILGELRRIRAINGQASEEESIWLSKYLKRSNMAVGLPRAVIEPAEYQLEIELV
jgi:hypothetical protein